MDRSLDSLDDIFKPYALHLLARLVEAEIPVLIVNTRRTDEEQAANLLRGVSWVQHSKHQDGLAIDIVPYYYWHGDGEKSLDWNPNAPVWGRIGAIGEKIGLVWGGRWTRRDLGHFEMPAHPTTERVI